MSTLAVLVVAALMLAASTPESRGRGRDDDTYRARRSTFSARLLLAADGEAWRSAQQVSWGPEPYATRFGALWGERGLFVRFDAIDPAPWHTMSERDDPLWNEEVVEIFIDPDGDGRNYAEIEINPHNVLCDLVIFEGSPNLRSDIDWDLEGLRSSVHPLRGAGGETIGWTAVALLPWGGFGKLPAIGGVRLPPRAGDTWRFNVFRVERPGGPAEPERDAVYAAWSTTSGPSFHEPAVFRGMEFIE